MTTRHAAFLLVAVLLPASACPGQLTSGPQPGAKADPLPAFAVTGDKSDQSLDFVAERGGKPTVFLFVRADRFDRPTARFIKTLDQELGQGIEGAPESGAVAVWLTEDQDQSKGYLPRAQMSLMLEKTALAVFEGNRNGPEGWSINDAATLTAVVVRDGGVVYAAGFDSLNETDVPKIVEALKTP